MNSKTVVYLGVIPYILDIDECSLSRDTCHSDACCINTPGSYLCTCPGGFSGNGTVCEGINVG